MNKTVEKTSSNTDIRPSPEQLNQQLLIIKNKLKSLKEVDAKRTQEILTKDIAVKNIARETQINMDALQNRKNQLSPESATAETLDIMYANFDILSGSLDIVKIYVDDLFSKMETLNQSLNKLIDIQRVQLGLSQETYN